MYRLQLCLLLSTCMVAIKAQDIISLYPEQDAVVGYHFLLNSENTNYNSAAWFGALSQPGSLGGENHSRSLIQFDLSSLPTGTVVEQALLDLYGIGAVGLGDAASVGNIGTNACWLEQIIEPWVDNLVTWNTQPATTTTNAVLLPESTMPIQDYLGIDVTGLVQAMMNSPAMAHGFALRTLVEVPTCGLFFCGAGFSDPTKRPRLRIKFSRMVGESEEASLGGPLAYPNPVPQGTSFQLRLSEQSEAYAVIIIDGSGRTVHTTRTDQRTTVVQVNEPLAPGTYRVVVKDPKGVVMASSTFIVVAG